MTSLLWIACNTTNNTVSLPEIQDVEFIVTVPSEITKNNTLYDVVKAIVTVRTGDTTATNYTLSELSFYSMGSNHFTQKISLPADISYKLTNFLLLDVDGNTIFACPLEGSPQADNVNDPLPIIFDVPAGSTKQVNIEVVSTDGLSPDDFGETQFFVNETELFTFLVSVSEINSDDLIEANLLITSGIYTITTNIQSIANNIVSIKDGYENYTLLINKLGYYVYENTFTADELKAHENTPLVAELESGYITDIDGNVYQTVTIGEQVWMAENLKVTHNADGTEIPLVTNDIEWGELGDNNTDKAYCYYDNNVNSDYGALYTWAAAMNGASGSIANPSGVQGVCLEGWHLPSDDEWNELINELGGTSIAGGKLKESGTTHWNSPNIGATNESGFTALPGGNRLSNNGSFVDIGYNGRWWSTSERDNNYIWLRYMSYSDSEAVRNFGNKSYGLSVRCVKD